MKIKNILLCSAATLLVTATAANAEAAKVVANKAHVVKKHVVKKKVVKAPVKSAAANADAGYISVPGTSSAVKIYGRVAEQATYGDALAQSEAIANHSKHRIALDTSARIGFETKSNTSLGVVHSKFEIHGDIDTTKNNNDKGKIYHYTDNLHTQIHFAYVEIGGIRFGIDESIFTTFPGGFGNVNNDGILNNFEDGQVVSAVSYTKAWNNGFSAIAGLEMYDRSASPKKISYEEKGYNAANFVGGVKYEQGWGDIVGVAAYDGQHKSKSARVRVDGKINDKLSLFALGSIKTLDDDYKRVTIDGKDKFYRNNDISLYSNWDGKWELIAGGSYSITPALSFNAQAGVTEAKTVAASADLNYEIAHNFFISPEIAYISWNDDSKHKFGEIEATNAMKGKHQVQALLYVCKKF